MTRDVVYTIRAMAARCRMTAYTLRYYERVGLIQPIERGRNGHRRYSEADEAWLKSLQSLRATHMPIREIRRYAVLREKGATGWPEQREILEEHGRRLEEQITKLKEALELLTAHIENLRGKEPEVSLCCPPLSRWEEEQPYVRRGKLLDFETSRGSAFTSASDPEA